MVAKGHIPLREEASTVHKINSVPEKNKTCSLFPALSLISTTTPTKFLKCSETMRRHGKAGSSLEPTAS